MTHQPILYRAMVLLVGEAAAKAVVAADGNITIRNLNKHFRRWLRLKNEFRSSKDQLANLQASSIAHMRPIICPLVLISEIQRSGGSLLSQLFDGHPELHAHPHELKFGFPRKLNWPPIDLDDSPDRWLAILFETNVITHAKTGYKKQKTVDETFPFLFLPSLQKQLFRHYIDQKTSVDHREVFNAYMTSYFGAWLNDQNIAGDKKYVTGFTARLAMAAENMAAFFEVYPDGKLISIVRNPRNWYSSARRHKPDVYGDIRSSLDLWNRNAVSMLSNKGKYGDRVCLLRFEDLINQTGHVMHHLADFIGIDFEDILLTPTFNKFPIKANTSFATQQHGIISKTLDRYKHLDNRDIETIDALTSRLYTEVLNQTVPF